MSAIELAVIPHQTETGMPYQHLRCRLCTVDGNIEPGDLKGLQLPTTIDYKQGIVIEGRGPIWLYGYLVHACHPAAWVGCYDPRLGAVVVASHTHAVQVGEVLPVGLPSSEAV